MRQLDGGEVPLLEVVRAGRGRGLRDDHAHRPLPLDQDHRGCRQKDFNANQIVDRFTKEVLPGGGGVSRACATASRASRRTRPTAMREMMIGFMVALVGMYVLMAIPLRSYVQPLIVMCVIPFGLVGAVLGHMVMGMTSSIMSMCGIVALAGVVVNDSLVLVDYVNRHRKEGSR